VLAGVPAVTFGWDEARRSLPLAVVFDVAGTLLRMYRVANDLQERRIIEHVVTADLIVEGLGRALVVPQADPSDLLGCSPDLPLSAILDMLPGELQISCSSSPVNPGQAEDIIRRSTATFFDLQVTCSLVMERCPGPYHTAGLVVDASVGVVSHTLSTGGVPFPGLRDVLDDLAGMGAEIYVASGDSMRSLSHLSSLGFRPDHIHPVADPRRKEEVVMALKENYRVVMVGDGLNDMLAFRAADLGVLTIQQSACPSPHLLSAADRVIRDIRELPIVLGKPSGERKGLP